MAADTSNPGGANGQDWLELLDQLDNTAWNGNVQDQASISMQDISMADGDELFGDALFDDEPTGEVDLHYTPPAPSPTQAPQPEAPNPQFALTLPQIPSDMPATGDFDFDMFIQEQEQEQPQQQQQQQQQQVQFTQFPAQAPTGPNQSFQPNTNVFPTVRAATPVPTAPAAVTPVPGPSASPLANQLRPRIHHKRRHRADPNNDPALLYQKPTGLASWGPKSGFHKIPLFQYYQTFAELKHSITLSRDDIAAFILGQGHPNPERRLTIWVQHTAAQSNGRYANGTYSAKCRYKDCPAVSKSILKGFYRVAFDEFSDKTGIYLDPMHNAFYLHLHCFESIFDLGYLVHHGAARHNFQILADTREFVHESRNPASITRDHPIMIDTYNEWVDNQKPRADAIETQNHTAAPDQWYTGFNPQPSMVLPHAQRLGCALTERHLSLENPTRAVTRERRGGVHIGLHKGDLAYYELMRARKQNAPKTTGTAADDGEPADEPPPQDKGKKRAVDVDTAEAPQPKRQRPADDSNHHAQTLAQIQAQAQAHAQLFFGPPPARVADTIYVQTTPAPTNQQGASPSSSSPSSSRPNRRSRPTHAPPRPQHLPQGATGLPLTSPISPENTTTTTTPTRRSTRPSALRTPKFGPALPPRDDRLAQRIGALDGPRRREVERQVERLEWREQVLGAGLGKGNHSF